MGGKWIDRANLDLGGKWIDRANLDLGGKWIDRANLGFAGKWIDPSQIQVSTLTWIGEGNGCIMLTLVWEGSG